MVCLGNTPFWVDCRRAGARLDRLLELGWTVHRRAAISSATGRTLAAADVPRDSSSGVAAKPHDSKLLGRAGGPARCRSARVARRAASTDRDFAARTSATIDDLSRGVGLAQAIQRLDPTGEFEWRLTNATHPTGGFERALAGWHEALEARAFHQEQVFAQLLTTGA